MPDNRLLEMVLFGELSTGVRAHRGPKKMFRNHLKLVPNSCNIQPAQLEHFAQYQKTWHPSATKKLYTLN
uniref:Uncharacterized protein n=1 Tax=Octopus bimaculoides TaxID=37653 RepID=A0A0L8HG37_OCTBM